MTIGGHLGALGFGNMGAAIVEGVIRNGVLPAASIHAYDIAGPCMARARGLGVTAQPSAAALVAASDIVLIAVKPQQFDEAAPEIAANRKPDALLVSIMAGISTEYIARACGGAGVKVARVMPNLPAQVGAGAAGFALNAACGPEDGAIVSALFDACGKSAQVPEETLDAVTALSGSGPAYFFRLAESMAAAAVSLGIPAEDAERLAAQTLAGAGLLVQQTGESPARLRARVTSKGGTTAAALDAFDRHGLDAVVAKSMTAARDRARELGK